MQANHYNLQPGRALGRHYRIIELLGEGFEGEVYKVEEHETGIIRAAKLFYKREHNSPKPHVVYAKKLHRLRPCPIVIQYHHQDSVMLKGESIDFLVSDFIDGQVLSNYIATQKQQRLTLFEALHLFHSLVLGVEKIHFIGEYHGDIHCDNVIVQRKGLHFEIHLIDVLHLGKPTKSLIKTDVVDLMNVLYELLGGKTYYQKLPENLKYLIAGKKKNLINQRFQDAAQVRVYLENLDW